MRWLAEPSPQLTANSGLMAPSSDDCLSLFFGEFIELFQVVGVDAKDDIIAHSSFFCSCGFGAGGWPLTEDCIGENESSHTYNKNKQREEDSLLFFSFVGFSFTTKPFIISRLFFFWPLTPSKKKFHSPQKYLQSHNSQSVDTQQLCVEAVYCWTATFCFFFVFHK